MNWRLAAALFALVFVVLAGSLITAALAMGYENSQGMIISVALGFVLSVPVTIIVTRQMQEFIKHVPH
ncbi:MAG: hypothetical protein Q7T36_15990 [Fluviicoccus sp.]|uniref:hypothetical protein n=1 Tax=Fluviicoccus sp. TaxID=2003552 RepID=UPI0027206115|nr:hypothetical protein [Fluviicoccus sp.]MDO8331966.1 hypothetical protein [Fluviicoccus sp.]